MEARQHDDDDDVDDDDDDGDGDADDVRTTTVDSGSSPLAWWPLGNELVFSSFSSSYRCRLVTSRVAGDFEEVLMGGSPRDCIN